MISFPTSNMSSFDTILLESVPNAKYKYNGLKREEICTYFIISNNKERRYAL